MNGGRLFRPSMVFSARRREEAAPSRAAADQAERFRRIMLPHMDAAYNLARYLTRDASVAEDIVQDAFLRAYRGFDGWHGDAPKAWLLAIVRNCFLTHVTARRNTSFVSLDSDEAAPSTPIDERHPEAIVAERSEADMLRGVIEGLPEPFRETLVLRELEELSYKDIAALSGVPIGTVMSRLARARQMLTALLLPEPGSVREAR